MSTVYSLEPPTKGKVVLKTNLGDIDIELWPKEAPKAVRNFVQHCLDGYYDNTIFHRVIKDYIIQGGDPTGTGKGGESIYGEPFKDEFHSRLRFTRRGLIACANSNEPNTNRSQFFITLAACPVLDKKNTIFGTVSGDTVYTVMRISEVGVDDHDFPQDPIIIRETEVLWSPFDDMDSDLINAAKQAKAEKAAKGQQAARQAQEAEAKKQAQRSKKNLALLSFGEDEEEGGGGSRFAIPAKGAKIRSAHDVLEDERLAKEEETPEEDRIRIAEAAASVRSRLAGPSDAPTESQGPTADAAGSDADFAQRMLDTMQQRRRDMGKMAGPSRPSPPPTSRLSKAKSPDRHRRSDDQDGRDGSGDERGKSRQGGWKDAHGRDDDDDDDDDDGDDDDNDDEVEEVAKRRKQLEEQPVGPKRTYGRIKTSEEVVDGELLKSWQLNREKYKQRKRLLGAREAQTMAKLAQFTTFLKTSTLHAKVKDETADEDELPQTSKANAGAIRLPAPVPKSELKSEATERAKKSESRGAGEILEKTKGQADEGTEAAEARKKTGAEKTEEEDDGTYRGQVRKDIDHREYMPAAWRVDDYLKLDDEPDLDDIRGHTLTFSKTLPKDAMSRDMDVDDYVVFDPLLEQKKGEFSKQKQKEKKRQTEWAGRARS